MRHPYSINSEERTQVPFYLAVLAVFISLGLASTVPSRWDWTPPLWVDLSERSSVCIRVLYAILQRVSMEVGMVEKRIVRCLDADISRNVERHRSE